MVICDVCESKDKVSPVSIGFCVNDGKPYDSGNVDLCEKCLKQASVNTFLVGIKTVRKHATGDDAWPFGLVGPPAVGG
jgi:hypothetical protein